MQQAPETPQGATGKDPAPLAVNVQRLVRRFLFDSEKIIYHQPLPLRLF